MLLNDEPIGIYVPLLMRPWVMQDCRSTASCHLGTTRKLRMLDFFTGAIGISIYTRRWLRHCLKRLARKASQLAVRWPVISMALPDRPGIAFSVDYFAPFRSRLEVIPTSCSSPIVSVAEPTYTQSLPPNLHPRAPLTFLSTGTFPSGDARASSCRTTASRFAQCFRRWSTSFLEFGKLPPAPTTQMAMVEWSV